MTEEAIGLLVDFTGGLAEFGEEMRLGFELAIEHINAAGGVLGRPVEFVIADSALEPLLGVEEARRLVEIEGVHAIVGPLASAVTLPVAESVTGPSRIPQIALGTSPLLTTGRTISCSAPRSPTSARRPEIAQLDPRSRASATRRALPRSTRGDRVRHAISASSLELVAIDPRGTARAAASGRGGAEALIVLAFAIEADHRGGAGPLRPVPAAPGATASAARDRSLSARGMYGGPTPSPPTDSSAAWADDEAKYGRAARTPT